MNNSFRFRNGFNPYDLHSVSKKFTQSDLSKNDGWKILDPYSLSEVSSSKKNSSKEASKVYENLKVKL